MSLAGRAGWRRTGKKECPVCRVTKPLSDFYRVAKTGAPQSRCKPCNTNKLRVYRAKNAERLALWRHDYNLKQKFSMGAERYDEMLREQGGGCALCGGKNSDRRLAVDHCHRTGAIRGLLCTDCNTGIGKMKDSLSLMQKAMEYLRRYGATWR